MPHSDIPFHHRLRINISFCVSCVSAGSGIEAFDKLGLESCSEKRRPVTLTAAFSLATLALCYQDGIDEERGPLGIQNGGSIQNALFDVDGRSSSVKVQRLKRHGTEYCDHLVHSSLHLPGLLIDAVQF